MSETTRNAAEKGYVNYYEVLGLPDQAHPGEVRKQYRKQMKDLVYEIARAEITDERRAHYLLEMAKLNAALFVLRDKDARESYWSLRQDLIGLEHAWREAAARSIEEGDGLRRQFDAMVRAFLGKYVEEAMLEAGRDKECVEASHWDDAHERHAFRILRHYRHNLYHDILERLPFYEVTPPSIDWDERKRTVRGLIGAEGG